ncbi:MAG TPA: zf-HC2 domain-containing protein [Bryobacteraceae bacterium]|jgi:anti-sigma factor RsiW|nr:zf-HC2 domain-containing protein [Bryobacteraceae bacterium]
MMTCADIEILLADYQDGTLAADQKSAIESHLSTCKACEELARDVAGAIAFMERSSEITAPPELVTRILFEISSGPSHAAVKPSWFRRIFGNRIGGKFMEPILQPRYAMGMAFTLLSFAMLGRFAGIEVRHLTLADLDPVKIWTAAEDRAARTWQRGVKYYESLRLVYEIESRVKEWRDDGSDEANNKPAAAPAPTSK